MKEKGTRHGPSAGNTPGTMPATGIRKHSQRLRHMENEHELTEQRLANRLSELTLKVLRGTDTAEDRKERSELLADLQTLNWLRTVGRRAP